MKRDWNPPLASAHRRRLIAASGALLAARVFPTRADSAPLPAIPELEAYLAGRTPQFGRLILDLPRLADDGNAVAMRVTMPGPFAQGEHVTSIALFSEKNPVPKMAQFEFPVPPARVEIESRVRLAGSQRVVAVAILAGGAVHVATAEVLVTLAACLDGP
ncbi:MAG TPA: thiosulfate oxidation carrier protein SoxY [Casimicrobiaceae bacterium]|nr:thiosulfate oxidation carrier protein SoxY [Casimicrobiaceae bacterium]